MLLSLEDMLSHVSIQEAHLILRPEEVLYCDDLVN